MTETAIKMFTSLDYFMPETRRLRVWVVAVRVVGDSGFTIELGLGHEITTRVRLDTEDHTVRLRHKYEVLKDSSGPVLLLLNSVI